ncbi:Glyceraldehyde-3-phosphate dehydrogenase, testis-specific like [Melia azedarach]|uniref:Glyceraldehyde-3-phosphate dehydrogenase, testis-specific like n=1 Tax=Melia azedarach TaxID=155640 RepID=A0ACC1YI99_MELAZ|nr:Glyceraldehyde-3-phosphate dehydrogenase, testis-specific like [Melia azedarach]
MSSSESESSLSRMLAFPSDDESSCHERPYTQPSLKVSFTSASFNPFQPTPIGWSIDETENQMSSISVEILKIKYVVPDYIVLGKAEENELASAPFPSRVALHPKFYKLGLRLPFHPFLRYMLSNLGYAPVHLGPNVWRAMISMSILWKLLDFPNLTVRQFQRLYVLRPMLKKPDDPPLKGWYYIRAWP